jgi:cation diffusion facilitator family transporter
MIGMRTAAVASSEPLTPIRSGTRRVVLVSLGLQIPQTVALAVAAIVSGSAALVAQTFAATADLAVQAFLVIGVRASSREADETHPVGYGRERYFWALYAALAIFVSGFTVAVAEALRDILNPTPVASFRIGYLVLGASLILDGLSFAAALRETHRQARAQGRSIAEQLRDTTEPATPTELIGNGIAFVGAAVAIVALALAQATGSTWPDTIASLLIGLALMVAAVALTQLNRSLLTGRGIHPELLEQMRRVIAAQPGVIDVPDLFAVVVGPSTLVVDGDVTFKDQLTVPDVEAALDRAAIDLRTQWPEVRYVYLTPVAERRPRGAERRSIPRTPR